MEKRVNTIDRASFQVRRQYFCTTEEFFRGFEPENGRRLILEVNAGSNPMGLSLASRFPDVTVVSQNIVNPNKNEVKRWMKRKGMAAIPENYYYAVGSMEKVSSIKTDALFSLFPNNTQGTMEWLPQLIDQFVAGNPNIYVAVVTEKSTGKPEIGSYFGLHEILLARLSQMGLHPTSQEMDMRKMGESFVDTEYSKFLQRYAKQAAIIEINGEKREEFLRPAA